MYSKCYVTLSYVADICSCDVFSLVKSLSLPSKQCYITCFISNDVHELVFGVLQKCTARVGCGCTTHIQSQASSLHGQHGYDVGAVAHSYVTDDSAKIAT